MQSQQAQMQTQLNESLWMITQKMGEIDQRLASNEQTRKQLLDLQAKD
jgi:hypothetical protein